MKNITFLLFLLIFSCGASAQNCEKQIKQLNKQIDSLEIQLSDLRTELNTLKANETELRLWITNNLNILIPEEMSMNPIFDMSNYVGTLSQAVKDELKEDYWLGMYEVVEIESSGNGIVIELSNSDLIKKLILTHDYFIVSFHNIMGDVGQSLIYSFKDQTTTLDGDIFATDIFSPTILFVEKDYYDPRDVEDPDYEGHIFETGTYNLQTREYTFIGKE